MRELARSACGVRHQPTPAAADVEQTFAAGRLKYAVVVNRKNMKITRLFITQPDLAIQRHGEDGSVRGLHQRSQLKGFALDLFLLRLITADDHHFA